MLYPDLSLAKLAVQLKVMLAGGLCHRRMLGNQGSWLIITHMNSIATVKSIKTPTWEAKMNHGDKRRHSYSCLSYQ